MTPAQVTMETVVEETGTKGLETVKEDMSLRCVSNCEDTAFDLEMLSDPKVIELGVVGNSDDVDIEGCCIDVRMGENGDDDTDATECSSSFGNSFSGNEDGLGMSDYDEIDSLYGEASLFDGFDRMFRTGKKKVTTQWRRYISPLTWRAKWMELRIKEMKSQLSKYDRELASYNQRELQFDVGQCTSEDVSVKSLPFSGQSHKKEVMKRKKRKRIEDVADVASYMSHHNLFSYYENKKSDADGASIDVEAAVQVISADVNTKDEFDINYACPSLEFRDENSLEHVLWKIEKAQLRVQKLKTQTDSLLTVHAAKFSSMESLSQLAQSDLPSSSPRSPALSSGNAEKLAIRGLCTPPRHIADYDIGDLVLPGSAVSSNGEVTPHPDLIESSMRPVSAEAPLDPSHIGGSSENIVNQTLLHSQEVYQEFEKVCGLSIVNPQETLKEENVVEVPSTVLACKPESSQEANTTHELSIQKSCLASDIYGPTKRKRGERKAGSGNWNADVSVTQSLS